ncbi:unnamed protein product [Gordionus sp. m RMFG-2023]|uniref:ceramide synthase 5-like n=1 Tax=Gordionus sp. m RMFG-2023 TaxID=3053472 RepID=UPI0030E1F229
MEAWDDIKSDPDRGLRYPEAKDLWTPLYLAGVIMLIRYIFERLIAFPLGRLYNLSDKPIYMKNIRSERTSQISHGNKFSKSHKSSNQNHKNGFLNQNTESHERKNGLNNGRAMDDSFTNKNERLLKRYKPSPLVKFSESCWRFTYYILAFTFGVAVLWNKPWFWDSNECWIGFPFQTITSGMYWYYMVEIGFYCSLMISQFKDVKRKDFWQMFIHHICTLLLLVFSWIDNMVRMGTLVLVIHDVVDFWMEAAKMANYCKFYKLCNTIFTLFTLIWFITRLVIYPYRVIYPALFIAHLNMDSFFAAYYLYNALLILLFFLHVFWFVIICKIAFKSLKCGKVEKDERSSSECDSDE